MENYSWPWENFNILKFYMAKNKKLKFKYVSVKHTYPGKFRSTKPLTHISLIKWKKNGDKQLVSVNRGAY